MTNIPPKSPPDNYQVDWEKLEAEARATSEWQARYGRPDLPPKGWEDMSLDELWHKINDVQSRHGPGVADSTYDAIRYVLYTHGISYSRPQWLLERLELCSQKQIDDLLAWIDQRNANHERNKASGKPISADVRKLVEIFRHAE